MPSVLNKILKKGLHFLGLETKSYAEFYKNAFLELKKYNYYNPGHFYSPFVESSIIQRFKEEPVLTNEILGIDLHVQNQKELLYQLSSHYNQLIWPLENTQTFRYSYNNDYFSFSDAIFLHSIVLHFQPKKIYEVGSGYSSAALLDINENHFQNKIDVQFVEPFPEERLFNLISESEKKNVHKCFIQSMPLSFWESLNQNDILFIDTSHVSKFKSDVNYIFFEILPRLKPGVIIHFHDIFFPFEYPIEWIEQGRSWNEAYLLRAFLQYNQTFKILLFPSMLEKMETKFLSEKMPLCMQKHSYVELNNTRQQLNILGQSIYIQKL